MTDSVINKQQKVADEVLAKMEVVDPYCILAGGAPRDWHMNNTCNDLDIYYYSAANQVSTAQKQLSKTLGIEVTPLPERDASLYSTMPFLRRIFEGEYKGMKIQLMQLTEAGKQFKVVSSMDTSISQIWYKFGKITPTDNFLLSVKLKAIWLLNGCEWNQTHPTKMAERFPDYKKVSEEWVKKEAFKRLLEEA